MRLGFDFNIWTNYKIKSPIECELCSHTSLLCTGSSGSGKSYALKYLLKQLLSEKRVNLTFCNFKNSEDFKFLTTYHNYFTYTDCAKGLEKFYNEFKQAQGNLVEFDGTYHILLFDEFPAFIFSTSLEDKKLAEKYKMMISEILMLGRSYGFGVWIIMQRPDSSFFTNGARDNFHSTISLGNLSKEAKSMLYSGEELPDRIYQVGEGISWIDGQGIREIKFPKIRNMNALEKDILNRLNVSDRREQT